MGNMQACDDVITRYVYERVTVTVVKREGLAYKVAWVLGQSYRVTNEHQIDKLAERHDLGTLKGVKHA